MLCASFFIKNVKRNLKDKIFYEYVFFFLNKKDFCEKPFVDFVPFVFQNHA